jgi:hypothetical protein
MQSAVPAPDASVARRIPSRGDDAGGGPDAPAPPADGVIIADSPPTGCHPEAGPVASAHPGHPGPYGHGAR